MIRCILAGEASTMNDILIIAGRSAAVYLFILIAIRLFGQKELAQLSIVDFVFILLLSNAVQNAMVGDNTRCMAGSSRQHRSSRSTIFLKHCSFDQKN